MDKLEQASKGSANENHFANNQKCARNSKRTVKTPDMVMLLIKLFAIAIFDALIDCEFPMTHCSLSQATLSLVASPSIFLKNMLIHNCHSSFIAAWQAPQF